MGYTHIYKPSGATYIVDTNGTTIKLIDGNTGYTTKNDSDATTIIETGLDLLTLGGTLFIKKGNYTISSTINFADTYFQPKIIGEGMGGTILTLDDNVDDDMFADVASFASNKLLLSISNIRMMGNSANNASGNGINITTTGAGYQYDCIFRDLMVSDFKESSFKLGHVHDYLIDKCIIEDSNIGIETAAGSYLRLSNSTIAHHASYGLSLTNLYGFIDNNAIVDNGDTGLICNQGLQLINNNAFWGNDDTAIATGVYDYITITGNTITGGAPQVKGITVSGGAQNCKICANAVYSHTTYNYYLSNNQTYGSTINGSGYETANAEEPQSSLWNIGDIVNFIDSGDASGDGLYIKNYAGTWDKLI